MLSSVVIAAGSVGDSKDTASKGVKAATKYDIGKNGSLKQKNLRKNIKKVKQKMLTKMLLKAC